MTDHYHSLTVVLEENIRDDNADALINAIMMLKGVCSVAGNVADVTSYMAEARAAQEYSKKILSVLYPNNEFLKGQ